MNLSRREWVIASLATIIGGCAQQSTSVAQRPGPSWPGTGAAPPRPTGSTIIQPPMHPSSVVIPTAPPGTFKALPRSQWAKAAPITARLSPMNGVKRITVHHEGYKTVFFSDVSSTMARLDLIRRSHLSRMKAGDIGYHYVIDRAGRVWEGRPIQYQGAHVGGTGVDGPNNAHNVGVMVLGNFDDQSPTDAQVASLITTVRSLRQAYKVPAGRIYTHQELSPTRCPGIHLQPKFAALRHNNTFA